MQLPFVGIQFFQQPCQVQIPLQQRLWGGELSLAWQGRNSNHCKTARLKLSLPVAVSHCTIRGNTGSDVPLGPVAVSHCTIRGNTGSDILLGPVAVSPCTIRGNTGSDVPLGTQGRCKQAQGRACVTATRPTLDP